MSRNILAPPLVYMSNNRRYRVNLVHEDFTDQRQAAQAAMKGNLDKAKQAYNERGKGRIHSFYTMFRELFSV